MSEKEIIKVEAVMNRVVFPHDPQEIGMEENEFSVINWDVRKVIEGTLRTNDNPYSYSQEMITVGSLFECPIRDAIYIITGSCIYNERFGWQYRIQSIIEKLDPDNPEDVKNFLSTILTSKQIESLYNVFSAPMKIIMDKDMESLVKVNGIGRKTADKIFQRYENSQELASVYASLSDLGISPALLRILMRRYHNASELVYKIRNTPYALCFEVRGIGFATADRIGYRLGIAQSSPQRIEAYIFFYLTTKAEGGNSWATAIELLAAIYENLGGKEEVLDVVVDEDGNVINTNINQALEHLQSLDVVTIEDGYDRKSRRVYLTKYYELEQAIAQNLLRLANAKNTFEYDNWQESIKQQEKDQGFEFTEEQYKGIELGLKNQVSFITGGGGVGKSTLVAGILKALDNYSFAQTALSGRAAARLQEITGESGKTIHRLLKYNPKIKGFFYNQSNQLPYDIIILDEVSLIGGKIFLDLIEAIPSGAKLIMLGDMGQLEAIGSLNIAHDIYCSPLISTIELTQIHRQAAKSGIITTSVAVRNQQQLTDAIQESNAFVFGEKQDFLLDVANTSSSTGERALSYFREYFNGDIVQGDIMRVQVLSTQRERGEASVEKMNTLIQEEVNPLKEYDMEWTLGPKEHQWKLRCDDKVMCIKNNYKMSRTEYKKDSNKVIDYSEDIDCIDFFNSSFSPSSLDSGEDEDCAEIFNGWMGKVTRITDDYAYVYFPISKETLPFTIGMVDQYLTLGYACTVHKCQGSSAPMIIAAIDFYTVPTLLTKEMVYTSITRAEKFCCLVAENGALRKAISSTYVSKKRTFLEELLLKESNYYNG